MNVRVGTLRLGCRGREVNCTRTEADHVIDLNDALINFESKPDIVAGAATSHFPGFTGKTAIMANMVEYGKEAFHYQGAVHNKNSVFSRVTTSSFFPTLADDVGDEIRDLCREAIACKFPLGRGSDCPPIAGTYPTSSNWALGLLSAAHLRPCSPGAGFLAIRGHTSA
jgi:hypothetical protein